MVYNNKISVSQEDMLKALGTLTEMNSEMISSEFKLSEEAVKQTEDDYLYETLLSNGFVKKVIPLSKTDKFLNFFKKNKKKAKILDYYLTKNIDNDLYEIYEIDIWYTQVRINGKLVFDKRRYDNKEVYDLIGMCKN
jgi:hypothetical protein